MTNDLLSMACRAFNLVEDFDHDDDYSYEDACRELGYSESDTAKVLVFIDNDLRMV